MPRSAAVGIGIAKPPADNHTDLGFEFHALEIDGSTIDSPDPMSALGGLKNTMGT